MTSPRKENRISNLRSQGHDTRGCVPVCGSVVRHHAAASGDAAKVAGSKSPVDMGEANITAQEPKGSGASTRRSPGLVFVLSTDRKPLDPCHAGYARRLLKAGKAAVFRRFPFTIILKERTREMSKVSEHVLKFDPGSKTTGIAIVGGETIAFAAELKHRGAQIKSALTSRRQLRGSRRSRKTRYRMARFDHRTRPAGWLAPSLAHRVRTIMTWVGRLRKLCPISSVSVELAKFDTQKMENPEISGVEYQQGELVGYEVREYLLEKWGRKCAYCGDVNVPLQVEHIIPKSRHGSNRVSNLTLACAPCNTAKGTKTAAEFGHPEVQAKALASLKDAAVMNSTRWAIFGGLKKTGLPVECGTGARTKFNRTRLGFEKSHWVDAACVGASVPDRLRIASFVLEITATGHGKRQMCGTNKYGFPIQHRSRRKVHFGFKTGDMVCADVPSGKNKGMHIGRVLCRRTGSFDIQTPKGRIPSINQKRCRVIHRQDGYRYSIRRVAASSQRVKPVVSVLSIL